jgi:hypothetical protein
MVKNGEAMAFRCLESMISGIRPLESMTRDSATGIHDQERTYNVAIDVGVASRYAYISIFGVALLRYKHKTLSSTLT